LLSDNPWAFWLTVLQFLAFHAISYFLVSWYYPITCLCHLGCISALFVVDGPSPRPKESLLRRLLSLKVSKWALAVTVVFAVLNAIPKAMPGPPDLTGECRQVIAES